MPVIMMVNVNDAILLPWFYIYIIKQINKVKRKYVNFKHQYHITIILIKQNEKSKNRLNLTDVDAPIMKGKKGEFDTFYNVQVGCCENQFITLKDIYCGGT